MVSELQDKINQLTSDLEAAIAERDVAVDLAAKALDFYEKNGNEDERMLKIIQALKQICVICPSISGRIEV